MGVPIQVEADPKFAGIAESALSGWGGAVEPGARRLSIGIASAPRLRGSEPLRIEVDGGRLRIRGALVAAEADAASGTARCRLAPALADDPGFVREQILDPLLLFLLSRSGRTPVHASAFLIDDVAVLLAGPSGSGKSCLAVAAHRAGFEVLSDDTVHVQLELELRIWGVPRPARLYPKDAAREGPLHLRNGKLKQLVTLGSAPAAPARKVFVCRLAKGTRAELQELSAAEAEMLFEPLEPGFNLLASDIRAASRALVRNGAWRLTLSDDPSDAITLLARMVPVLGPAA